MSETHDPTIGDMLDEAARRLRYGLLLARRADWDSDDAEGLGHRAFEVLLPLFDAQAELTAAIGLVNAFAERGAGR